MRARLLISISAWAASLAWLAPAADGASAVWKVTDAKGGVLYLGGSVHALRGTDYPLPPAFNRAFDASSRLAFEVDPQAMERMSVSIKKAGEYPKGDSLKNHVDARTYDYVRRVFKIMRVPEAKFSRYRPWMLALALQSPNLHGLSDDLGVDRFLAQRARANSKPMTGLETAREHAQVFTGVSDVEGEALLLLLFVPRTNAGGTEGAIMNAWRRGDAEYLSRATRESFRDYPALAERLLDARNKAWLPQIERFLASGKPCFVVVGAAHLGGSGGLLSLLRARGFQTEQL